MGWAIALHGGAGKVLKMMPEAQRESATAALNEFLDAGVAALNDCRPALEVVEQVVRLLENCPQFNAGIGSVLTSKGTVEMEASIMEGTTKKSGAVSGLSTVVNPISLARLVMEKTPHVYLAFEGAEAFARDQCVETKDPSYFITPDNQERLRKALEAGLVLLDHCASSDQNNSSGASNYIPNGTSNGISNGVLNGATNGVPNAATNGVCNVATNGVCNVATNGGHNGATNGVSNGVGNCVSNGIWNGVSNGAQNGIAHTANEAQFETVGCVAVDVHGHCAAATSTGGLVNKMVGRIGDTPLIGAGTYADEYCAVSATGKGEAIIQTLAAKEVSSLMEHRFLPLREAVETVVWKKLEQGTAGLIAVSSTGEVAMSFNTLAMYRAAATEDGFREIGIWDDVFTKDEDTEPESVTSFTVVN